MTCDRRDKAYPEFSEAGNPSVARFVDTTTEPNPKFLACDEWVYIYRTTGNPAVPIAVTDQFAQTYNVDEPFFVSGKLELTVSSVAGFVAFMKAPRRELLSWLQKPLVGASNDPVQSVLVNGAQTLGALASAANWFYLDGDLVWQQAVIGDIGAGPDPFGASGLTVPASRRGRYYDVSYQFESTVGTLNAYIVHRIGTARPAFLISLSPTGVTGQSGIIHVGDDTPISPLGGFASAGHAQASMLGSQSWTIAVTNNVAATLSGNLIVTRRGF